MQRCRWLSWHIPQRGGRGSRRGGGKKASHPSHCTPSGLYPAGRGGGWLKAIHNNKWKCLFPHLLHKGACCHVEPMSFSVSEPSGVDAIFSLPDLQSNLPGVKQSECIVCFLGKITLAQKPRKEHFALQKLRVFILPVFAFEPTCTLQISAFRVSTELIVENDSQEPCLNSSVSFSRTGGGKCWRGILLNAFFGSALYRYWDVSTAAHVCVF